MGQQISDTCSNDPDRRDLGSEGRGLILNIVSDGKVKLNKGGDPTDRQKAEAGRRIRFLILPDGYAGAVRREAERRLHAVLGGRSGHRGKRLALSKK